MPSNNNHHDADDYPLHGLNSYHSANGTGPNIQLDADFISRLANEMFSQSPDMQSMPAAADPSAAGLPTFSVPVHPSAATPTSIPADADSPDPRVAPARRPGMASHDVAGSLPTSPQALRELLQFSTDTPSALRSMGQPAQPVYAMPRDLSRQNSSTLFNVDMIRRDFPTLHQKVHGKPLIWMDSAATSQKPQQVIDAESYFYEHDNSNIHRGAHALAARATDAYEGARAKVQHFIGAAFPEEIIYVRGTTEGINLLAQTCGRQRVGPGDEIILTAIEHHANIVPWQFLAEEKGATLKVVPITDSGEVMLSEYARMLNPRVKIVALTQVSNTLGTVVPVEVMGAMARQVGAAVVVDGAQSVPHFPVNVQALDCDFLVFSGHKLFGPTGIGILYGKKELLEEMPPWQGGGNMIQTVTFEQTTFNKLPYKFEAGTGHIAGAVGLGAAIDYLNQVGFAAASQYEHGLLDYAMQGLSSIPGIQMYGTTPEKVSTLSFNLPGIKTEDVGKFLDQEGIAVRAGHHCAQPTMQRFGVTGMVRPSLALYNTYGEVDALVNAVYKARRMLS